VSVEVRDIIARDLRPVRPLWPPSRRAVVLIPIAVAIVIGVPALNFFRTDLDALGFFRAWGLSIAESASNAPSASRVVNQTLVASSLRPP